MKVRYTRRARDDLIRIEAYLRQHSPHGAARVGARIRKRIDDLAQFPRQSTQLGRVGDTRMLVVTRTRYLVVYRVTHEVEIITVIHASQQHRR